MGSGTANKSNYINSLANVSSSNSWQHCHVYLSTADLCELGLNYELYQSSLYVQTYSGLYTLNNGHNTIMVVIYIAEGM